MGAGRIHAADHGSAALNPASMDFDAARRRMVDEQLRARGLRDLRVIEAMASVPRERFVPADLHHRAYDDCPLPIGHDRTISQPYIVALMAELLALKSSDRVLEVGTGSGYAAAVLAELAGEVFTIERHAALAQRAQRDLAALGYEDIKVRAGDGSLGWPEAAPFDAILVSAGGPVVPESLRQQLAISGRMVIPVGHDPHSQRLLRLTRRDADHFEEEHLAAVTFVRLIGAEGWGEEG